MQDAIAKELRATLSEARGKIWPGLVKTSTNALTAGTAGAVALQYLVGGPFGLLAGSIAGASLGILNVALEQRASFKKSQVAASASVAYLSQVIAL